MNRLRTGDEVIVTAGKDAGKRGKVRSFAGDRCIVEGVNLVKKHVKPNPNKGERGGILPKEAAIHVSNIMLYNDATGKGDRVGFKVVDGKKVRYFKSNDQVVDS